MINHYPLLKLPFMVKYLGAFSFFLLTFNYLSAEGTKELMPSGSSSSCKTYVQGNDGTGKEGSSYGRNRWDLIHIHVSDPEHEVIYYGFTRLEPNSDAVYYRFLDPDSNVVLSGKVAQISSDSGYINNNGIAAYTGPKQIAGSSSSGYQALILYPQKAGDYMLQFNVGSIDGSVKKTTRYFIHPFDVTVANTVPSTPAAIPGRVFSYRWHLNTASSSNKACMSFYTWTPDSLVVRMDMNQIQPFGFSVSYNSYGVTKTGNISTDRKSSSSIRTTIPEYRVFLNEPDINTYPSGTPGQVTYLEVNACEEELTYCLKVTTTKVGQINVYLDLNNNGTYNPGTEDVYFPYNVPNAGESCIPWDGLDGNGHPVGNDFSGRVMVEFLAGIVHFPVYDPENNTSGFTCDLIRPSGNTPLMYWDNTSTAIGTKNLTGCSSGCNSWTSNKGDNVMVNTWMNTITSADTAAFVINPFCAPKANPDTACTLPGLPIELNITANDYDPDNSLDLSSVNFLSISPEATLAFYDAFAGTVFFIPEPDQLYTITLNYTICDNTDALDGGPLCASTVATVNVVSSCPDMVVLNNTSFPIEALRTPNGVGLNWIDPSPQISGKFSIERQEKGGTFKLIHGLVNETGIRNYFYEDTDVATGNRELIYRIRKNVASGASLISEAVHINLVQNKLIAHILPNPADRVLDISYKSEGPLAVNVFNVSGSLIWSDKIDKATDTLHYTKDISDWAPGIYFVRLSQEGTYLSLKLLVQ